MTFDLVVAGGDVLDPGAGLAGRMDVGVRDGRIAAVGPGLDRRGAARVVDAGGALVLPGLVDLHTHVYWGATYYGVLPGPMAARTGVTTWVDAGSAGAYGMAGLKAFVADPAPVRVRCFINVSCLGLAAPVREVALPEFCDVEACVRTARRYEGFVVGVKVRASAKPTGAMGVRPLELARRAARELGLPLMVHIGNAPPELSEVLPLLEAGDVVTHCFTGHGMSIVDGDGRVREMAASARERGVLFDVGHGSGSFAFPVAGAATEAGFWPDVISTDAHVASVEGEMGDLARCMSKLLALGMPLARVVEAATAAPARVIGMEGEIGTLRVGARADVTLAAVEDGRFAFRDIDGVERRGDRRVTVRGAIAAGRVLEEEEVSKR
jgi:dihydroorotase